MEIGSTPKVTFMMLTRMCCKHTHTEHTNILTFFFCNSLLHAAAAIGSSGELVEYLASKMDVNDVNEDGDSALHFCYRSPVQTRNDEILLRHGANMSLSNKW
jgi:hypothetical protein